MNDDGDDDDHDDPPMTADRGRVVFDRPVGYDLWSGRVLVPRERAVLIAYKSLSYSTDRTAIDTMLRYDVPGIAPLVFLGYRHDHAVPTRELLARLDRRMIWPKVAMVELRPQGQHLVDLGRLTDGEVIRLGLGLCDTILAWDERCPFLTAGLRPETVYMTGEPGIRYYTGATPRIYILTGNDGNAMFSHAEYDPPTGSPLNLRVDDVVFTVAQLLWFASRGEHAYSFPGHLNDRHNVWYDIRRPFTGPPELGRLLEAVLIADIRKRMKARELRHELEQLATRWSVELPPFPPPGLAI